MSRPRVRRVSDLADARIGVGIALAVGLTWGFRSIVTLAQPDPFHPIQPIDYLAVVSFSVALAVLSPAAWLVARVAERTRWRGLDRVLGATAIILAVSAPIAGFGNLIEDGFGAKDVGGALYVAGLSGVLCGLLGLSVSLALGGRWALAGLCAATFGGILASEHYVGGLVVLAVWLVFASSIWRPRSTDATA